MYTVSRRQFLKALGATAALSAGGIALIEAEPIVRSYFLPPRGGWPGGPFAWEIAIANEALRILNSKLEGTRWDTTVWAGDYSRLVVTEGWSQRNLDSLLARRQRLVERLEKLARGWAPARRVEELMRPDGVRQSVIIHGGRHVPDRP